MSEITKNSDLVELGVEEFAKDAKPKSKKKASKKEEEVKE